MATIPRVPLPFAKALALHLGNRTARWLAGQLGVERSTVSHWLNGRREPNLNTLRRIAAVLGCSSDALLGLPVLPASEQARCEECGRELLDPYRRVALELIVEYAGAPVPQKVTVMHARVLPADEAAVQNSMLSLVALSDKDGAQ